jgi:DNA-binding transcriptional MocR family regulator
LLRYEVMGVELDGDGMIPEALEKTLTELQARGE